MSPRREVCLCLLQKVVSVGNKGFVSLKNVENMKSIHIRIFMACLLFVCLLSSCKDKVYESDVLDLSSAENVSIDDVFVDVELTPLLFEKDTYPSVATQIRIAGDIILVCDKHNIIHVFDKTGHYVSCSEEKYGNGPNEYSVLLGFGWNPYSDLIEILTQDKLLSFDCHFNMISSVDIPTSIGRNRLLFDQIFDLSQNSHIFVPTSASATPYRYIVFNSKENKVEYSFDFANDIISPVTMQNQSFYEAGDGRVYFFPPGLYDKFYEVDKQNGSVRSATSVIYGKNAIRRADLSDLRDDLRRLSDFLEHSSKDYYLNTMTNGEVLFIIGKHGRSMRDFFTIVVDFKTAKNKVVNLYDDKGYKFPLIGDINDQYAYAVYSKDFILQNRRLVMSHADSLESLLANIDDEDFVLLRYRIKNSD